MLNERAYLDVRMCMSTHSSLTDALVVQGKARLGTVVHMKNAAALALTAVKGEDQRELDKVLESAKTSFNEAPAHVLGRRHHGPQVPGQGPQARQGDAEGARPAPGLISEPHTAASRPAVLRAYSVVCCLAGLSPQDCGWSMSCKAVCRTSQIADVMGIAVVAAM